jgi:hypothetical protein
MYIPLLFLVDSFCQLSCCLASKRIQYRFIFNVLNQMTTPLSISLDTVIQFSKRKERMLKIPRENVTRAPSPNSANLTVCVQKLESQNATLASDNAALISRNEALASENATLITQNTEKDANITARKAAHAALSRKLQPSKRQTQDSRITKSHDSIARYYNPVP